MRRGAARPRAGAAARGRGSTSRSGSTAASPAGGSADGATTSAGQVDGDESSGSASRPPVQRLDSIARGAAGRAKYKPKNRRRDQDERERAEMEERARQTARDQAAARELQRGRGRARGNAMGRGGRGRGDAMGRGRIASATASGPFAQAPAAMEKKPGQGAANWSASSSRAGTVSRISSTPFVKRERTGDAGDDELLIKSELLEPVYPDEDEDGDRPVRKVDIELINLVSSDEEDVVETHARSRGTSKGGLRPVRLHREEHKDRVMMVNTDAPDGPTQLDSEGTEAETADASASAPTEIKTEAGDVNVLELPEASSVAKEETEIVPPLESPTERKKKPKLAAKPKPVLQTEEDKAEYAREQEDIQILAEELGGLHTSTNVDAEGDVDMDGLPQVKDKEGRLYLFQFPPILPPLVNNLQPEPTDAEMAGAASTAAIDLTGDAEEVVIKPEPSDAAHAAPAPATGDAGYIGKLIVRESGRVELSWGGTIFQLGRGADFDFLTSTVITDHGDADDGGGSSAAPPDAEPPTRDATPARKGAATGMGKVMGKFVATPVWEDMI